MYCTSVSVCIAPSVSVCIDEVVTEPCSIALIVQRFHCSLQKPQKRKAWSVPYLEGLLHCVIQSEHGLRSTVDAFRLQEVVGF